MAALLLHVSYWHIPKEMQRELMSRRYAAELKRQAKAEEARNPSLAFRLFALREW